MANIKRSPTLLITLACVAFFLSLHLLRIELVLQNSPTWNQVLATGYSLGIILDFVSSVLPLCIWLIINPLSTTLAKILYVGTSLWIFLCVFANALYFKFFGTPIQLWVVKNHLSDLTAISDSVSGLSASVWVMASWALYIAHLVVILRSKRQHFRSKLGQVATSFVIFSVAFGLHQIQFNGRINEHLRFLYPSKEFRNPGNPSTHHAFFHIMDQIAKPPAALGFIAGGLKGAQDTLIRFRNLDSNLAMLDPSQSLPEPWKVGGNYKIEDVKKWRKSLGLDPDKTPNIMVFFIETWRAYEFLHPELGPKIYPNLTKIANEQGWLFTQAYTSSIIAGQTVRGTYSTLCSAFPNMMGPAPPIAHPKQDIQCLNRIMHRNGYQTAWMVPHKKEFHNKIFFEENQETKIISDYWDFKKYNPKTEYTYGWGEHEFYPALVQEMEKKIDLEKPFFIHTINVGTHHPWGPLPEELKSLPIFRANNQGLYGDYKTRLAYWDYSFGKLFETLKTKPWMKNTLILVVADHATTSASARNLDQFQKEEHFFRIPALLISLNMKPKRTEFPIHQLDLAPTLYSITGIKENTSFLGQNLMTSQRGTPWVFAYQGSDVSYRFGDITCYYFVKQNSRKCFRTQSDHLYTGQRTEIPKPSALTKFMQKIPTAEALLHGVDSWNSPSPELENNR